jgi:hypothetical protein
MKQAGESGKLNGVNSRNDIAVAGTVHRPALISFIRPIKMAGFAPGHWIDFD